MRFYDIDTALSEAIEKGTSPVRVRISLDWSGNGHVETVFEKDIIEASFTGLKEAAGGTTARGEVLLDNTYGAYACGGTGSANLGSGREVRISFSVGDGLPYFERFVFFVDDKGFQDVRGPGRRVRLTLRDRAAVLRKTDESRDWTMPSVFVYSLVCDKTQPEKSLVHLIAQRAGLGVNDIDCATIPVSLPYARITKNVWAELSELATAYRCHLECPVEKPLVFAHSPYQSEVFDVDEASYTFKGSDIFYLRFTECAEQYCNAVRLKINIPVALEKQEIWRYCDPPVVYNEYLTPRYPFRFPAIREIEKPGYEARYMVKDGDEDRAVIYADSIDTQEEAELRLGFDGGAFRYSAYDVTSHRDRAGITLHRDGDGDLYGAAIYGRPIVLDLNRSCFLKDTAAVMLRGTAALNVTGSYFSEDLIDGKPQYEDWAKRELAERLWDRREITVKTHRGVFHARVGAVVMVHTEEEMVRGTVNALSLRYKRGAAFVAEFRITEVSV
ncbi:hypothetical protein AGMMS49944_24210 [Spirochaetia bacterium]|nr:hypothetical protein AGMMS49944_24210 [Spirochaetia bacterium]